MNVELGKVSVIRNIGTSVNNDMARHFVRIAGTRGCRYGQESQISADRPSFFVYSTHT